MSQKPSPKNLAGTGLIEYDPWLAPYAQPLHERYQRYQKRLQELDPQGRLTGSISLGHQYFGLNRGEHEGKPGVWYREWAPGAEQLWLFGDFNEWDRRAHPLQRDEFGVWHLFLPDKAYADRLTHESLLKVCIKSADGEMDRIPAYIRRVVQDEQTHAFTAQFWSPPKPYRFQHAAPTLKGAPRIYEAHVGMAVEEPGVGTYEHFTDQVIPRIADLGYNTIQLMAIPEHPYYGSFGYHVSSFFAPASRFGTPEQLKRLVDTAHAHGLLVVIDLVHSHAVKNLHEGLNRFDGTDHQYFHAAARGDHPAWDSKVFDYSQYEVLRFLLSNVRYWMEEFAFDGFRFDGVTSMMYLDHGLEREFASYDDYFGENIDDDAVAYLQLASTLVHELNRNALTIAEDMSGMVGMARPVEEGGIGFTHRLAMGVPDFWIKLLKERRDEDWPMNGLYHVLLNRRRGEQHIGYCESHDQALVGDKTIAFWLMDEQMYWHMSKTSHNDVIDRGIALHKMIRLITFCLAGEGYLNFMGNEFGHPEWVDFPREGNNFSYQYARRQWSLVDDPDLRYRDLAAFDKAMQKLDDQLGLLSDPFIEQLAVHEHEKLLVARRGPFVLVFNFHPFQSLADMRIPVPDPVDYRPVLDTDWFEFGGMGRTDPDVIYPKQDVEMYGRAQSIQLYLPTRTAQILMPVEAE